PDEALVASLAPIARTTPPSVQFRYISRGRHGFFMHGGAQIARSFPGSWCNTLDSSLPVAAKQQQDSSPSSGTVQPWQSPCLLFWWWSASFSLPWHSFVRCEKEECCRRNCAKTHLAPIAVDKLVPTGIPWPYCCG